VAEDEKGKLLQLPCTYYLRSIEAKQTWQQVGVDDDHSDDMICLAVRTRDVCVFITVLRLT